MAKSDYDTGLARMAGNIASGMMVGPAWSGKPVEAFAEHAVAVARAIVAEIKRTEHPPLKSSCQHDYRPYFLTANSVQNGYGCKYCRDWVPQLPDPPRAASVVSQEPQP